MARGLNICKTIILLLLFESCVNEQHQNTDNTNSDNSLHSTEKPIEKRFDADEELFLNFYFGMSKEDYKEAVKESLVNKKLHIKQSYQDYQKMKGYYVESDNLINENHISKVNFDKWEVPEYITTADSELLLYRYSIDGNNFYAYISPVFNLLDTLTGIMLKAPVFNWKALSKKDNQSLILDSYQTKEHLIELYSKKYGKPTIEGQSGLEKKLSNQFSYDKRHYVYISDQKRIEISLSCCINFETTVSYQLIEELERREKLRRERENMGKEIDKKNEESTLMDI